MDRDLTQAIRGLAERQHGVVGRSQLIGLGVGAGALRRRADAGTLIPLYQGVFALGHGRIGRKGEWMAAVLACGPGAVLSHSSAMELWGLRGSRWETEVLRRSGGPHRARSGIRVHQTRALDPRDVTVEMNIPVTAVERTLVDMAGRLDAKQLERALVNADRAKRIHWPELQRHLSRGRGRKGIARLRRVAEEVDPRAVEARSGVEIDFLALCRDASLPTPWVNVLVEGHLVDFLWPAQRVVVETDSYAYHRDRPAFEGDHERTVALTAAGYLVHRATDLMLSRNPALFMNLVRQSLSP
jgi:predicted transcriptional regulator of viral defense system